MLDPAKTIGTLVKQVQDSSNALTGAQDASELMTLLRQAQSDVARLRRSFFRMLTEQGYELEEIGDALDPPISKERVRQIVDA